MTKLIISGAVTLFMLLLVHGIDHSPVNAQQPGEQWTVQQRVPYLEVQQRPLIFLADQDRTVHAFIEQIIEDVPAIVHMSWSVEEGWKPPVDILLAPYKRFLRVLNATIDEEGVMHLILKSGDELGAHLYYTKAPGAYAGNAQAWSQPKLIGEDALAPFTAALAGDGKGNLYAIYSGRREGNGVYAVHSTDGGESWSMPVPIFFSYGEELIPNELQLFLGESGQLHAVWCVVNSRGHGTSGHYARLDTQAMQWSVPIDLDETSGLGIRFPSVVEHDDRVFVTYYNGSTNNNWWRESLDYGHSWSIPWRLSALHRGTNGGVSFVVDSQNTLHLFFGQRIDEQNHGMWHSTWQGSGWSPIEPVVSGTASSTLGSEFDPTFASAIMSQGNTILVTWTTDAKVVVYDVWHSYKVLDVPELPVVPLPVPILTPQALPTLLPTATIPTATPTPEPVVSVQNLSTTPPDPGSNGMSIVFLSMIPSVLLSAVAIILYRLRRRDL